MKLDVQKRIAASVLKCSPKRVVFDNSKIDQIKEAITKADIRGLIIDGVIYKKPKQGISNARTKKIRIQKAKGKRKGHGSRKGKKKARTPQKREWINKVRLQRELLKTLKEKNILDNKTYWMLYRKSKGGFFRSRRHLRLYIEEQGLNKKNKEEKNNRQIEKSKKGEVEKEKGAKKKVKGKNEH